MSDRDSAPVSTVTAPARPTPPPLRRARWHRAALAGAIVVAGGCTPRAPKLSGEVVPASRLPSARLAPGHRRVIFRWSYQDLVVTARGEGVARIAPPDSVRLDFFLDGGMGGGFAIVIGDSVFTPNDAQARRYLPPPPLLWATLGRLAVPPAADTLVRGTSGAMRADIGTDPTWRASFDDAGRLDRLERIADRHIAEWVARTFARPEPDVRYRNERARRSLDLSVQRTVPDSSFDASIWRR